VVVHACNPSTQEAEAIELQFAIRWGYIGSSNPLENKQKTGISTYLSTITLNGLPCQLKHVDWLAGLKNKSQLFVVFMKLTSVAKIYTD
jgi:hypothetical protein